MRRQEMKPMLRRKYAEVWREVNGEDLTPVRKAWWDDTEIRRIAGAVALNNCPDEFNHVAGTEVGFPEASKRNTGSMTDELGRCCREVSV